MWDSSLERKCTKLLADGSLHVSAYSKSLVASHQPDVMPSWPPTYSAQDSYHHHLSGTSWSLNTCLVTTGRLPRLHSVSPWDKILNPISLASSLLHSILAARPSLVIMQVRHTPASEPLNLLLSHKPQKLFPQIQGMFKLIMRNTIWKKKCMYTFQKKRICIKTNVLIPFSTNFPSSLIFILLDSSSFSCLCHIIFLSEAFPEHLI